MDSFTSTDPVRSEGRLMDLAARAAHEEPAPRSALTRVIHFLLLLIVVHQLAGSEFMSFPFPGDPPSLVFRLHEYTGLLGLAVLGAFWLWTMVRRGETRIGRLIPWLSAARRREVVADLLRQLKQLAAGRLPDEGDGALASAVHGLGLLAVSAIALTGGAYYFIESHSVAHVFLQMHKMLANVVWAYLIAHAGIAVLHHFQGSDIFARMFWAGRTGRR